MKNNPIEIRTIRATDLEAVVSLQSLAYRSCFWEKQEVFAEKLRLFPNGCRIAYCDARPAAYLFSHPWTQARLVALNAPLCALPPQPDCYYIHDLCVAPQFRGEGLARRMVAQAKKIARDEAQPSILLVAVQGSQTFWQKFGFSPINPCPETRAHLRASYGADAALMQGFFPA